MGQPGLDQGLPGAWSELFKEKLSRQIYSQREIIAEGIVPWGLGPSGQGRPQAGTMEVALECAQTGKAAQIQAPGPGRAGISVALARGAVKEQWVNSLRMGAPAGQARFGEQGRAPPAPISRATRAPIPGEMPGCDYPADRNSCSPHTACNVPSTKGAAWNAKPAWLPAQRGGTLLLLPQKGLVW